MLDVIHSSVNSCTVTLPSGYAATLSITAPALIPSRA